MVPYCVAKYASLPYFFFEDSGGRVKILLLRIFCGIVFTYLKYFPNLTGMVVCLPLMNVFSLSHVTPIVTTFNQT